MHKLIMLSRVCSDLCSFSVLRGSQENNSWMVIIFSQRDYIAFLEIAILTEAEVNENFPFKDIKEVNFLTLHTI
jgi:hypothetical protein